MYISQAKLGFAHMEHLLTIIKAIRALQVVTVQDAPPRGLIGGFTNGA